MDQKELQRTYSKRHYDRHTAHVKAKNAARRKAIALWLREYKSTLSCQECGFSHPAALDFHHRDSAEKKSEVGDITARGWCIARIQKEIAKCDVLCSNCHRIQHYQGVV